MVANSLYSTENVPLYPGESDYISDLPDRMCTLTLRFNMTATI